MAPKFDVYAHVTDTIIAEIEAGTPPWRKPWTGSASGIALPTRHNGEEYRGINILMLWVMAAKHGYVSSRWMTYKQGEFGWQRTTPAAAPQWVLPSRRCSSSNWRRGVGVEWRDHEGNHGYEWVAY